MRKNGKHWTCARAGYDSPMTHAAPAAPAARVHRFEVTVANGRADVRGEAVKRDAASLGLSPRAVRSSKIYLIEAPLDASQIETLARRLLADPVLEHATVGVTDALPGARVIEVHPLPGAMDPAAQTVRDAARELLSIDDLSVTTGWRFDVQGIDAGGAEALAKKLLANTVIQAVHFAPFVPDSLPKGAGYDLRVTRPDPRLTTPRRAAHGRANSSSTSTRCAIQALSEGRARADGRRTRDARPDWASTASTNAQEHHPLPSPTIAGPHRWSDRPSHGCSRTARSSSTTCSRPPSPPRARTRQTASTGPQRVRRQRRHRGLDDEHALCIKVETHTTPRPSSPTAGRRPAWAAASAT